MKTYKKTRVRRLAWALLAGTSALLLVVTVALLLSHFQVLAQPVPEVAADSLVVDKDVSTNLAAPGETLVYTITVENKLTSPIDAWMTDTLPAELTLVSGPNAIFGQVGFENGVITWSHTLAGWQTDQITFSTEISPEITYAEIVNTARVTGTGELVEDSAETLVVVDVGNLDNEYTDKSVSSNTAAPGDVLTYTIRIENRDSDKPYSVPNAWFTDTLPSGLTYITGSLSVLDPTATFGFDNGVITWSNTINYLGYDEVRFSAQISPDLPYNGWITNTVEIVAPLQSFTREAGTWSQRRYPHLEASKSVYPNWVHPGECLTYTVRIANTGDGLVETAWMTDVLPSEVNYVPGSLDATTGDSDAADDVITWNASLAPSEVATITFVVETLASLENNTSFINTAEITGAGSLVQASVEAEAITTFEIIFPLIFYNYPPVSVLNPIPTPADHSYTVSWQGIEADIDHYVLEQARTSDFASIEQSWTTQQTSQYVGDVYCAYYYRVRADKASDWGEGPWSNVEAGEAAPPTPTLSDIPDPDEDNSYTVSWSSVPVSVDRYVLQESTDADFSSVMQQWQTTGNSQLIQKGSTHGTFYYRVRADDDDCWGQGPWSDVKSVTTIWSYYDDFSDYQSGWPREWSKTRGALYEVRPYEHPKCPGSDCPYDGNGYTIARRSSSSPLARFGPGVAIPSADYEIEVKARWWDANYFATYQIFFGANSSFSDYYAVQVRINEVGGSPTCEYSVVKNADGTTYLQNWTYTSKINCRRRRVDSDASWNKWKIQRDGKYITIWVGGNKLGSWKDSSFGANRYFGVGCTLYEGFTPSKPEYDNWSVTLLP